MSKHTPGPWKTEAIFRVVDSAGRCIARAYGRTDTEREANAKLMVAATGLLQLAREVLTYFGEGEIDPFLDIDQHLRDTARDLIAKAEGRS